MKNFKRFLSSLLTWIFLCTPAFAYSSPALFAVYVDEFYVDTGWFTDMVTLDWENGLVLPASYDDHGYIYKNMGMDLRGATIRLTYSDVNSFLMLSVKSRDMMKRHQLKYWKKDTGGFITEDFEVPSDLDFVPEVILFSPGPNGAGAALKRLEILFDSVQPGCPLDVVEDLKLESPLHAVRASWDAVQGATGYSVMVDDEVFDAGDSLTFTLAGLMPCTAVKVSVRAYNESGEGPFCKSREITVSEGDLYLVYEADFENLSMTGMEVSDEGTAIKRSSVGTGSLSDTLEIDDLRGALIRVEYETNGMFNLHAEGQGRSYEVYKSDSNPNGLTVGEWFIPPNLPFSPDSYHIVLEGSEESKIESVLIFMPRVPKSCDEPCWVEKPTVYYTVEGKIQI